VYTERAYAEGTAYSRGVGLFINSTVAAKRCPRVVYPQAGQFGQILVSAKLHLCWCYTFAGLGASTPPSSLARGSPVHMDPLRRLSVLVCPFRQRTASGTRKMLTPERLWHQKRPWHQKSADTQKGSGTRKVLTPRKALALEKLKGRIAT
jgi:hypothetical protein